MGADDYLAKPCRPRELVARINAIIRRTNNNISTKPANEDSILKCGTIGLDLSSRSAKINNHEISFTSAEYNIISTLVKNAGNTVSKEELSELALGRKLLPYDRSIDVHISNIRKKLEPFLSKTDVIKSIRGVGYLLPSHNQHTPQ